MLWQEEIFSTAWKGEIKKKVPHSYLFQKKDLILQKNKNNEKDLQFYVCRSHAAGCFLPK